MNQQELEMHLQRVSESIQRQNLSQTQLQTLITTLQQQLSILKNDNDSSVRSLQGEITLLQNKLSEVESSNTPVIRDLDDIAGVRTPKWYDVNIDFTAGDSTRKFGSIEINPDGPFVITQVTPVFQFSNDLTGSDVPLRGRSVPITAFPMLVGNLGSSNANPTMQNSTTETPASVFDATDGSLGIIPEFSLEIEIAGSGRYWTNQPVHGACFYGYFGQPLFLGVQGWVERTDRIVVNVSPEVAVPKDGTLRVSFHGYQILGHVNISEALGY